MDALYPQTYQNQAKVGNRDNNKDQKSWGTDRWAIGRISISGISLKMLNQDLVIDRMGGERIHRIIVCFMGES